MKCAILIDFDDTLVETTVHFNRAKSRFARIMGDIGFPVQEALETLNKNDIKNVELYGGFLKQCFPLALGETYEYFCHAFGREYSLALRKEIEDVGWWVFDQPVDPILGSEKVLTQLHGRFNLFLATKGDPLVQQDRVKQSGLSNWFEKIYILPDKNIEAYRHIALEAGIRPTESWVVGNSIKSDINPALMAGFKCIHVHHPHTWDYEDETPLGGHISVNRITDILEIMDPGSGAKD